MLVFFAGGGGIFILHTVDGNLRPLPHPCVELYVGSGSGSPYVPRALGWDGMRWGGVRCSPSPPGEGPYPRPAVAPPRGLPAAAGCHVCGAARPATGGRSAPPARPQDLPTPRGNPPGADTPERRAAAAEKPPLGPLSPTGPGRGYWAERPPPRPPWAAGYGGPPPGRRLRALFGRQKRP